MHARMLTRMHARPSQTCVHACPCTWNLSYISFDMSACKYIVHTSIHAWCMQPCKALDLGPVQMHARACPHAHKCTSACQSVHASACTHTLGIAQKRLYGLVGQLPVPASTEQQNACQVRAEQYATCRSTRAHETSMQMHATNAMYDF